MQTFKSVLEKIKFINKMSRIKSMIRKKKFPISNGKVKKKIVGEREFMGKILLKKIFKLKYLF